MTGITSPLRLTTGSHEAGSGRGCAMNVISWENGDTTITGYPSCTARPLARLIQLVNDTCCVHRDGDLLCPPCSAVVLDLAHSVTGTAGATREQEAAWLAEQLDSLGREKTAVTTVADLLRRRAAGDEPAREDWDAAVCASAARTSAEAAAANDSNAIDVVYFAAYVVNAAAESRLAHARFAVAEARLVYARQAIAAWHRICGTLPAEVTPAVTASAVEKMLAKS